MLSNFQLQSSALINSGLKEETIELDDFLFSKRVVVSVQCLVRHLAIVFLVPDTLCIELPHSPQKSFPVSQYLGASSSAISRAVALVLGNLIAEYLVSIGQYLLALLVDGGIVLCMRREA